MKKQILGPILIMIAASLWAVDALFRTQLTFKIPTTAIIFGEYLISSIVMLPVFKKNIDSYKSLTKSDWLNLLLMVLVSSVLGIVLFTQALDLSFAQNDFATPVLLQKLQPIFVIILSAIFLKERVTPRFIALASMAFIGSYLISFGFNKVEIGVSNKELVYVFSILAALCWGSGTILSKKVLQKLSFEASAAIRIILSMPIAFLFMIFMGQTYDFTQLGWGDALRFLIISLVTGGAFAIYLYYKGLKNTKARVSTIAELFFPIISIIIAVTPLNPYGAPQVLNFGNILGIVILLSSILAISFLKES